MLTEKQARAMEYISQLKEVTHYTNRDGDLLYIRIGGQEVWIFRDGFIEGKSLHVDWLDQEDFDMLCHSMLLMKNLLYYIEHGHNEVTT